ncbi:MAG: YIP1 family protein [Clostridia bacterium]|nr:YIP1 family protein [Clostridia bacterium]
MKNRIIRFITVLLALVIVVGTIPASATNGFIKEFGDIPYDTFTYWNGANVGHDKPVRATGMYNYYKTYFSEDVIGVDVNSFTDVSVDTNDMVYVLDGATSRIHIFDKKYDYVKTIGELVAEDGTSYNYAKAESIVVSADGIIYVCDTENQRVLLADFDGKLIGDPLLLPDSNLIPEDFKYRPMKIAVDSSNYIYVLSDGSYYGAILYSPNGDFLGFFGANTVPTTVVEFFKRIWEGLIMTDERRATAERKLPFQFTDLYVDGQDFIYTATGRTKKGIEKGQVKRLSPGGLNILESDSVSFSLHASLPKRNDYRYPNVEGLAVSEDNYIYTYDNSSGYISIFDNDCNMLNTFGGGSAGNGDQDGTFMMVSAIDLNSEKDIIVLDDTKKCMTVFKLNDHGRVLMEAGNLTRSGDYEAALPLWQQVLKNDRNCQVAYSGIARVYYAAGDYDKAMEYAKIGFDYHTYSLSFEFVRTSFIEEYIYVVAGVLLVLVVAIILFVHFKRKKNIVILKNQELKLLSRVMLHPGEVFNEVKQKKRGSVLIGFILIVIYYVTATIMQTESGFLFKSPNNTSFNSLLVLLQTVGVVLLWTICNWGVCTLQEGKGKMREIFVVTSYSLVPLIISNIVYTIASNAILASEAAFLNIFVTVMQLFTAYILIMGTIIVHDYSFGKFVGTSIMSLLGILIVVFLGIVIVILVQQVFMFLGTIYREFMYR